MESHWVYLYLPKVFCAFSFIINPIFVYLILSEKSSKFGNYKYLLLYFAIFNLVYSLMNVVVPLDIHSYRYCFFLILNDGWFVEVSNFNTHILAARCSLVVSSYAVLLSHFIYRYLVIYSSSLTRNNFHIYMTASLFINLMYLGSWHIFTFFVLARLIIHKLNKITVTLSKKTSKFQVELLRALVVQTVIPIFISFSPCVLSWYSPMFGIQLARGFNYFEVSALGVFAFVDPIAIILCIPIFRRRLFCRSGFQK